MLEPPLNPMLLSNKEIPFDSEDYIFELKWDGYRCIAFINNSNIFLQSRNKKDLSIYFPELHDINKAIKSKSAVLDGEICYLDSKGKSNFSKLQRQIRRKNTIGKKTVNLIIWDILSYDNKDIYQNPLLERKETLNEIVKNRNRIIIPRYIKTHGKELFKEAEKNKLEGIVAKNINSPYEFKRSKYWYKIKCWQYANTIIGGYSRNGYSLLVGMFDKNRLNYMGKVKMAMEENIKEALFRYLPKVIIKDCPFEPNPHLQGINWVKPVIKTVIRYTEISRHNTFRHGYAVKIIFDIEEE